VSTSHKGDIAVISIQGDVTAVTGEIIGNAYGSADITNSAKLLLHLNG